MDAGFDATYFWLFARVVGWTSSESFLVDLCNPCIERVDSGFMYIFVFNDARSHIYDSVHCIVA